MAQCQYANVTTFIQRCVCVSVYESKRGTEREIYTYTHTHTHTHTHTQLLDSDEDPLCIL